MAIAHGRKIIVDGVEYRWRADGSYDRFMTEWTSPTLFLTLVGGGFFRKLEANSKEWTPDHTGEYFNDEYGKPVGPHKVMFGPGHVEKIIRHTFAKDETLTLGDWDIVEVKRLPRPERTRPRLHRPNQRRVLAYSR